MSANTIQAVREFHDAFEYPTPNKPCIPDWSRDATGPMYALGNSLNKNLEQFKKFIEPFEEKPMCMQRAALMLEELAEFVIAMADKDVLRAFDALLDLRYVNDGSVNALGLAPVFAEGFRRVHASNMSKLKDGKVIKDDNGKVVKGDWYQPVDLSDLI